MKIYLDTSVINVYLFGKHEERLLHRTKFAMDDPSDQPHVISAYLTGCDAIVTYDRHFQKIKKTFPVFAPSEIISLIVRDPR